MASTNISYGTETFALFGEITTAEAYCLAKDMARVDAVSMFDLFPEVKPDYNPDTLGALTVFRIAESVRALALDTLVRHGATFNAAGAEFEFKTTYTHEFFGHFMCLLYSKSLGNRGL